MLRSPSPAWPTRRSPPLLPPFQQPSSTPPRRKLSWFQHYRPDSWIPRVFSGALIALVIVLVVAAAARKTTTSAAPARRLGGGGDNPCSTLPQFTDKLSHAASSDILAQYLQWHTTMTSSGCGSALVWSPRVGFGASLDALAMAAILSISTGRLLFVDLAEVDWDKYLQFHLPMDWRDFEAVYSDGAKNETSQAEDTGDSASLGSRPAPRVVWIDGREIKEAPYSPWRFYLEEVLPSVFIERDLSIDATDLLRSLVGPSAAIAQELDEFARSEWGEDAQCDIGVQLRTGEADGNTFGLGYLSSYDDVLTLIDFIWAETHAHLPSTSTAFPSTLNLFLTTDARGLRSSFVDDVTHKFLGTTVKTRYLSKPGSLHSFKHALEDDPHHQASTTDERPASATTFVEFFQLSRCRTVVYTGGSNFGRMAAVYGDLHHQKRTAAWEFLFKADSGSPHSSNPKGQTPHPRHRRPYSNVNSINLFAPGDDGAQQMFVLETRYTCGRLSATNRPISEFMSDKTITGLKTDPYLDC